MDIYKKLAKHLDNLPAGYPPTESGVELRILKRLFTPEEAAFALHLTLIPEEPRVVARRAKVSVTDAAKTLESMAMKGLLFRVEPRNGDPVYMAAQFVVGMWEYHLNDLDPDFIKDMHEYGPILFPESWKKPQLRTIPVGKSLSANTDILTYEKAEELVSRTRKALVAPCICRREKKMMGEGCDKPDEVCLVFDIGASYYEKNGLGRIIEHKEVMDILKMADESGLVLQPGNAQKIMNICCCCGCCCGVLEGIKQNPKPVDMASSPFFAVVDMDLCMECGLCEERCQMDAITMGDELEIDLDRCIGCGLCVTTCPGEALTLERKPESEVRPVPEDTVKAAIQLAKARGKLGAKDMVMMQIKSKMDRLLASKSK